MENNEVLVEWLGKLFHAVQIDRIELHHVGYEFTTSHIKQWKVDGDNSPEEVVKEIVAEAEQDARSFDGKQRYAALCFIKDQRQPSRRIFIVNEGSKGPWSFPTEEVWQMTKELFPYAVKSLTSQPEGPDLFSLHEHVLGLHGQFLDMAKERAAAKGQLNASLSATLPQVIVPFLTKYFPQQEALLTPVEQEVYELIRSLSDEQGSSLLALLDDHQKDCFSGIISMLKTKAGAASETPEPLSPDFCKEHGHIRGPKNICGICGAPMEEEPSSNARGDEGPVLVEDDGEK